MKNGYKAILITAAILLGTGVIATGAGLLMGARVQDVAIDNTNLTGWHSEVPPMPEMPKMPNMPDKPDKPNIGTTTTSTNGEWRTIINETYTEKIDTLQLSAGMGEITVYEGKDDSFSIMTSGNSKDVEVSSQVNNGTWRIETRLPNKFTTHNIQYEMAIILPKGWQADNIDLLIGMGSLDADMLQAKVIRLEAGAGEIDIEKIIADEAEINCAMGSIDVDNAVLNGKTTVECGMGEVDMTIEGSKSDYGYRFNVGMGEVSIGDDGASGIGAERSYNENAAKFINADCGMGSINIEFTK